MGSILKLKIISDGTSFGTRVVNAETGEELQYVKSIRWEICSQSRRSNAIVELANVELDVTSHAETRRPVSPWGFLAWRSSLSDWLPWRKQ